MQLLHQVFYEFNRTLDQVLGLTTPQVAAIQALKAGPLTMGELAEALGYAYSTLTDLADRLERNGLVIRVRDTEDRRVVRLALTDSPTVVAAINLADHVFGEMPDEVVAYLHKVRMAMDVA